MTNKNPSEWRVGANPIAGSIFYNIYRLRDINEIDHSGNRETCSGLYTTRAEAEVVADMMNEEEADGCNRN